MKVQKLKPLPLICGLRIGIRNILKWGKTIGQIKHLALGIETHLWIIYKQKSTSNSCERNVNGSFIGTMWVHLQYATEVCKSYESNIFNLLEKNLLEESTMLNYCTHVMHRKVTH